MNAAGAKVSFGPDESYWSTKLDVTLIMRGARSAFLLLPADISDDGEIDMEKAGLFFRCRVVQCPAVGTRTHSDWWCVTKKPSGRKKRPVLVGL